MVKKVFISNVISEATVGGLLPMNIPLKRIEKIIDKAYKKFVDNDDRLTQEDILVIDTNGMPENCLTVRLPDDVKSVTRLEYTDTTIRNFGNWNSGMRSVNRYGTGADGGGVLGWVSRELYNSFMKMNQPRFLPYDWSEYTHTITLEAVPIRNIFIEVARLIGEECAYDIDDFETYCASQLTLDFVKFNNFTKTKLIGGREINFNELKSDAKESIKEIKDMWKEEMGNGVMLLD